MRLLFYNWTDYLSQEGGGVTTYLRNIMLSEAMREHEAFMLSSGVTYELGRKPFWRAVRHPCPERAFRFEIVNSAVLAPAMCSFGNPKELCDASGKAVLLDFIRTFGPFDVIHLHNFEGLSLDAVRAVKKEYPCSKFVFSMHNYFPFCPQVNFWQWRQNRRCQGQYEIKECSDCDMHISSWSRPFRILQRIKNNNLLLCALFDNKLSMQCYYTLKRIIRTGMGLLKGGRHRLWQTSLDNQELSPALDEQAKYFLKRRNEYVQTLNEVFDCILCVSERVREISLQYGLDPIKMQTDYIGTGHAHYFSNNKRGPILAPGLTPTLTYLGYAREDKGFFFLLRALEEMPEELAGKIAIQLCVKLRGQKEALRKIHKLRRKFKEIIHLDGYTHEQLDGILGRTTLGLIPVLWEDNLPQVALEMHCHGIPLLCSDLGGAKELSGNALFTFRAGCCQDFIDKLSKILTGGLTHESYWPSAMHPTDMETHVTGLLAKYAALGRTNRHQAGQ